MKNKEFENWIRKFCPDAEREKGRCGCEVEARIGQTNFFPKVSTDLKCRRKVI